MNLRRLRRLVAAYGARPERWPAAEREAAGRLLAASAEARALLAEAEALDALLARPTVAIEPEMIERLGEGIARRVARLPAADLAAPASWINRGFGLPLRWGAFAAAALMGVWLGWSEPLVRNPDALSVLQLYPLADEVL